ncbi:DUF3572 domain-containing protein [Ponticoccus sp. SC2-23]|uniref:DUF3572 domain-containing protein n=1 Tax=Alexandriicola marinus TaxID=2081710 RepID=UPI000FDAB521|nr:DUF3572 domain-containing protein [Alexandriicola marinus]MBM1221184.1 DUF3572 domain-containing protein [Ponticoccus sp. SC6-9]MBM1225754.1 DUF3572 domain-containing protein [Ponticoccus sp. SC6-15]MBM1227906.1 DUF3572 domain-containing protein [Ponticoccus sp. SC6-38]MBM1234456.1 DUF3572 domain-containing protein [Ponticoccus sp. SC6-45]MBM1238408.1 DUF3572 domain-containing protein [Ponticoccus sp. SC6-49]MBM1243677.1 DUF3572 domain-containing protein [Ponticoccus sp. SC2-64]MBM1247980
MTPDRAEDIAVQALVWIAGHEDLGAVFLGATGAAPEELRQRASDPVFLLSVLEFLTMDDAWVMGFCDAQTLDYAQPMMARKVLAGPGQDGWD